MTPAAVETFEMWAPGRIALSVSNRVRNVKRRTVLASPAPIVLSGDRHAARAGAAQEAEP
jgi:hypothetical protein